MFEAMRRTAKSFTPASVWKLANKSISQQDLFWISGHAVSLRPVLTYIDVTVKSQQIAEVAMAALLG